MEKLSFFRYGFCTPKLRFILKRIIAPLKNLLKKDIFQESMNVHWGFFKNERNGKMHSVTNFWGVMFF
ncbi:hypothetical protein CEV08_05035 [Bartonella tribocorum]|uniref:Uncharacterized protein n=1 Tax=Bartonella tribocorum TaxID=85701 RepID=A0A2M6UV98_9HYPH|nr:hypothetical protein CEV08_05035 [Bartonella tribocorum]